MSVSECGQEDRLPATTLESALSETREFCALEVVLGERA